MTEGQLFAAQTQAKITIMLIGGLFFLVMLFLGSAFVPWIQTDERHELISIAGTVVSQVLPIAALAAGFWFARHRTGTGVDSLPLPPTPPETTK